MEQDSRFNGRAAKAQRRQIRAAAPAVYKSKVDLSKVNMDVIHEWISARVIKYMGMEDDVLIDTIHNMIIPVRPGGVLQPAPRA